MWDSVLLKPPHATSDDEFRQTLDTNLFTAFAAVCCGARLLREHVGSIVLLPAAKAGITGLTAATYAPQDILVDVISPGLIRRS